MSKKHHTNFHGSSSQPNSHLAATKDALQINRTGAFTVLPTANVEVRSQNGRVDHLRALINNCAQTNVITLQTIHRVGIKPTEAPNRKNGVNQKNNMSTHDRMNLTILPKPVYNLSFLYGVGKHQGSLASKYTNRNHRATKGQQLQLSKFSFRQAQHN